MTSTHQLFILSTVVARRIVKISKPSIVPVNQRLGVGSRLRTYPKGSAEKIFDFCFLLFVVFVSRRKLKSLK